jgi:hypothetical protein
MNEELKAALESRDNAIASRLGEILGNAQRAFRKMGRCDLAWTSSPEIYLVAASARVLK